MNINRQAWCLAVFYELMMVHLEGARRGFCGRWRRGGRVLRCGLASEFGDWRLVGSVLVLGRV